jgi:transposase
VLDNFSPHRRREVARWSRENNIRLVFTPTYASWLNRIEPLFAGVRYFALNNSDYQDHEETRREISAYVAWRNRRPVNAKLQRLEKHKLTSGSRH